VANKTNTKVVQADIIVDDMLEKMTKVLSADEVDFWSDCADQISILAEIIKGSPNLSDKEKVGKLNALLDEYGYFTE